MKYIFVEDFLAKTSQSTFDVCLSTKLPKLVVATNPPIHITTKIHQKYKTILNKPLPPLPSIWLPPNHLVSLTQLLSDLAVTPVLVGYPLKKIWCRKEILKRFTSGK